MTDDVERGRIFAAALEVIASRPGVGADRWGNALSENEHMQDIAQTTLEGNLHYEVRQYLERNS